MIKRIEKDKSRFRSIIRGKVKKELKKYITHGEMIGKQGKEFVSIPIPRIDIPHFRYDTKKSGGVGQGEGDIGTPIGRGKQDDGRDAGDAPGAHVLEVDIPLDELAKMLGEELELPNIKPKGKKNVISQKDKYTGISDSGPESLRHFKRTFKRALRRQIINQNYDPEDPIIIPIRADKRYRTWKTVLEPESNAVIIYMMDVSGSMGFEQKEIVRIESFWIDTWLHYQYKNIETRYIIHDAVAREVDKETFYHTRESGGTIISSAYKLAHKMIQESFDPNEWNIYLFHFSDGDNWGEIDTDECIAILKDDLLTKVNLFCYGQVERPYGSGQFIHDLEDFLEGDESIVLSEIPNKEGIYDSIKEFLGKGK